MREKKVQFQFQFQLDLDLDEVLLNQFTVIIVLRVVADKDLVLQFLLPEIWPQRAK